MDENLLFYVTKILGFPAMAFIFFQGALSYCFLKDLNNKLNNKIELKT